MKEAKELPLFVSGNLLGSLPLELLTNQKVRELYFNNREYTFLCFGFKQTDKKVNLSNTMMRSFLTFGDLLKLGYKQTINSLFGISKLIELGSYFITKQSMINTLMWCH